MRYVLIGLALFALLVMTGIGLPSLISSDKVPLVVIIMFTLIAIFVLGYILYKAFDYKDWNCDA